jgi:hypothetical protein
MRRVVGAVAAVAAVAFLVGACGGKARLTKADYERQVNRIGNQLSTTLNATFSSPKLRNPSSLKDAAGVIRAGQKNLQDAADRLDQLNPPEQVEKVHDQLVKGFRDFAQAFGRFAQATEKGDLATIQSLNQQVSNRTLPAMVAIQKAIDALKAKGFDISD